MRWTYALAAALLAGTATRTQGATPGGAEAPEVPCDPAAITRFIAERQAAADRAAPSPGDGMDGSFEERLCGPNADPRFQEQVQEQLRAAAASAPQGVQTPGGKLNIAPPRLTVRQYCEMLAGLRRPLSPHEPLSWHWTLDTPNRELARHAAALGWRLDRRLYVASVAEQEPNLRVVPVPGCEGDRVMFFHRGFRYLAYAGVRYLGELLGRSPPGKPVLRRVDREAVLRAVADTAVQARYARLAGGLSGVPDADTPPPEDPAAQAVAQGIELFAMAHELAHVARGHVGELAAAGRSAGADRARDGEIVSRWAQELEADFHATRLFLATTKGMELDGGTSRLVRWSPLMLMANLESLDRLRGVRGSPGAAPPWPEAARADSAARAAMRELPRVPTTEDFAAVLARLGLPGGETRSHPPEHVRAEVVRLALLRNQAITPDEYSGFTPADAWVLGLRLLGREVAPRRVPVRPGS